MRVTQEAPREGQRPGFGFVNIDKTGKPLVNLAAALAYLDAEILALLAGCTPAEVDELVTHLGGIL